jgi:hypothetical protein
MATINVDAIATPVVIVPPRVRDEEASKELLANLEAAEKYLEQLIEAEQADPNILFREDIDRWMNDIAARYTRAERVSAKKALRRAGFEARRADGLEVLILLVTSERTGRIFHD